MIHSSLVFIRHVDPHQLVDLRFLPISGNNILNKRLIDHSYMLVTHIVSRSRDAFMITNPLNRPILY